MQLHIVPARTGLQWIQLGWQTFRRQPLALCVLLMLTLIATTLIGLVPVVGTALGLAMLPTMSLVMMVGAAEALHNRVPTPALLLVAFQAGRERMLALAMLGLLYALSFGLVLALSTLLDGGKFAAVYLGMESLTPAVLQSEGFQAAMWLSMLAYVPLSTLFWHAPALVHWHGIAPVKAMFFSAVACWRNVGAFALYGLGWMGALFIFSTVLGMVTVAITAVLGQASAFVMVGMVGVMLICSVLAAAVFLTSIVFTFRDCFGPPDGNTTMHTGTSPVR